MLLIHNDDFQVRQRSKQRRARADHQLNPAPPDLAPLVVADALGDAAVHHGDFVRVKPPGDPGNQLRREGNFRDQINGRASRLQRLLDGAKIHFRFAAARHAVQQDRMKRRACDKLLKSFQGFLLLFIEHKIRTGGGEGGFHRGSADKFLVADADDAFLQKPFDDGGGRCGFLHQRAEPGRPFFFQAIGDDLLPGRQLQRIGIRFIEPDDLLRTDAQLLFFLFHHMNQAGHLEAAGDRSRVFQIGFSDQIMESQAAGI